MFPIQTLITTPLRNVMLTVTRELGLPVLSAITRANQTKPPIVNQQCLVYKFECDLCDAGYVGFTRRHLHQRVEEHKNSSSSVGKHLRDKHSLAPKDLTKNFSFFMKYTSKFDRLVHEMFFIHELRPTFNVQSDSIRAKVFN